MFTALGAVDGEAQMSSMSSGLHCSGHLHSASCHCHRDLLALLPPSMPDGEAVNCWCGGRHLPAVYKEAPGLAASVDRFAVTVAVSAERERPF